jgi:hypothetical protein
VSKTSKFKSSGFMPSNLHTNGAKSESKMMVTDIPAATIPTLLRLNRIQAICRGLRLLICPALLALSILVAETMAHPFSTSLIRLISVVKVAYFGQLDKELGLLAQLTQPVSPILFSSICSIGTGKSQ